jgi:putative endonuclease
LNKLIVGRIGEQAAAAYLLKHSYKIIACNYRTRWHEIDIVAQKKELLIFVEVRTKEGDDFGTPEETIDCKKLGRVTRAAEAYAAIEAKWCKAWRIDAICVVLANGKVERLNHYENIIT